MTQFKPNDIVTICTDTLECTEAEEFLYSLLGTELQIVEVTDEYKDLNTPTYKCAYLHTKQIVSRDGINYFPFIDADLQKLAD